MSEYIEDRIKRLETRLGTQAIDITAQQFSIKELKERVKALEDEIEDLKEQMNILADDYKIFRSEDYTDQSTEEFVKVVRRGECVCYDEEKQDCKSILGLTQLERPIKPTDYCSRGEKK